MTIVFYTGGPIRPGDLIYCPKCGHSIEATEAWVVHVCQILRHSTKHSAQFEVQSPPEVTNEFPEQALDFFRCEKCAHRGAVKHPTIRRRTEVVIKDPYNITHEEAKAVVASEFCGMTIDQVIRMHNQLDDLGLSDVERAAVEAAFRRIDFGGVYDGMVVSSKPNRANQFYFCCSVALTIKPVNEPDLLASDTLRMSVARLIEAR